MCLLSPVVCGDLVARSLQSIVPSQSTVRSQGAASCCHLLSLTCGCHQKQVTQRQQQSPAGSRSYDLEFSWLCLLQDWGERRCWECGASVGLSSLREGNGNMRMHRGARGTSRGLSSWQSRGSAPLARLRVLRGTVPGAKAGRIHEQTPGRVPTSISLARWGARDGSQKEQAGFVPHTCEVCLSFQRWLPNRPTSATATTRFNSRDRNRLAWREAAAAAEREGAELHPSWHRAAGDWDGTGRWQRGPAPERAGGRAPGDDDVQQQQKKNQSNNNK